MTRNKFQNISNPELLSELQASHPQVHHWIQEKQQQLEQAKTDKEVEEIKKSLADKK